MKDKSKVFKTYGYMFYKLQYVSLIAVYRSVLGVYSGFNPLISFPLSLYRTSFSTSMSSLAVTSSCVGVTAM